jgi:RHS repeat-associated protein
MGTMLAHFTGLNSGIAHYGTNGHRDITWTADSTGAITRTARYDPWGGLLASSGSTMVDLRYQGAWYDTDTDLHWVVTRWYAPTLGRFVSEDTLLGSPTNPKSRHLYAYAEGDPVGGWDPDGRSVVELGRRLYRKLTETPKSQRVALWRSWPAWKRKAFKRYARVETAPTVTQVRTGCDPRRHCPSAATASGPYASKGTFPVPGCVAVTSRVWATSIAGVRLWTFSLTLEACSDGSRLSKTFAVPKVTDTALFWSASNLHSSTGGGDGQSYFRVYQQEALDLCIGGDIACIMQEQPYIDLEITADGHWTSYRPWWKFEGNETSTP